MTTTTTKTAKRLTPKQLDTTIERLFGLHCHGVEIPILAIPSIYKAARTAYAETGDLAVTTNAIVARVNTLRRN